MIFSSLDIIYVLITFIGLGTLLSSLIMLICWLMNKDE